MKLIIDIPDGDYEFIKSLRILMGGRFQMKDLQKRVINAIKNGIPVEERISGYWSMADHSKENTCES